MTKTFDQAARDWTNVAMRIFGDDATAFTCLTKLNHEIDELRIELDSFDTNHDKRVMEFADCFMCLIHAAGRAGITIGQITDAMVEKTEINANRTWNKNPDGTYSHKK